MVSWCQGFSKTGIEGKLNVIEYARKNKGQYFCLCYGNAVSGAGVYKMSAKLERRKYRRDKS